MAGSYPSSRVTVEVFVEEDEVPPMWVGLKLFEIPENGPAALLVLQEDARHPARQLSRHLPQSHHLSRPGWKLDLEVVAQIVMKLLQRLDQQVVHWEPNRPPPIGVPAE